MEGRTISHYRIVQKLGEGGMGVVYLAQDLNLSRQVALKFLAGPLASSLEMYQRLVREANFIASLSHTNIATIYELEQDPREPFLALEYLPGGTLRTLILELKRAGKLLPIEKVLEYGMQIAGGLAHAHQRGIVHGM